MCMCTGAIANCEELVGHFAGDGFEKAHEGLERINQLHTVHLHL